MVPVSLFMGLEATRLNDDQADSLAGSIDVVSTGAWSLSPYQGPAIQPYLGVKRGAWSLAMAPAVSMRNEDATDATGREAELRTTTWRFEARLRAENDWGLVGVDGALAGGSGSIDDIDVEGTPSTELTPNLGAHTTVAGPLQVVGRLRWPMIWSAGSLSQSLGGAVALEWRLGNFDG